MLRITLDTNTVRPERLSAAIGKIPGGVDVATTTTVAREIGSVYDPELRQLHIVPELFVLDESRLGGGALVSDPDAALVERVLDAISTARSLRQGNETNYHPAQRSRSVTR